MSDGIHDGGWSWWGRPPWPPVPAIELELGAMAAFPWFFQLETLGREFLAHLAKRSGFTMKLTTFSVTQVFIFLAQAFYVSSTSAQALPKR